jgi:hypothetical protein
MQATLSFLAALALAGVLAGSPRIVTVAQSGAADVVGNDNVALQKAVQMLRPGDTLQIGPGTYEMHNSLFVPSGVTVRGTAGKTILMKSRGVESALTDDGDYGENILRVAEPEKFRPGMGIAVVDDQLKDGWDISISSITGIKGSIPSPSTRAHSATMIWQRTTPASATPSDPLRHRRREGHVRGHHRGWTNAYIDGCRGGAIYMYNVKDIIVRNCTAEPTATGFHSNHRQCPDPQLGRSRTGMG